MDSTWATRTPCDMVCPDCRRELPRGTVHHRCTDRFQQPLRVNVLEVMEHGRKVSRTVGEWSGVRPFVPPALSSSG